MTGRLLLICCVAALAGCAKNEPVGIPAPEVTTVEAKRQAALLAYEAQEQTVKGNDEEAIRLYLEAVNYDREMGPSWHNLGVLHMKRGALPDAVNAFNIAAELMPTDPRPIANIGQIWLELGYPRPALEQFEDALLRDPVDMQSLRGAILSAQAQDIADERTSEWIRTALYRERDLEWIEYFQIQRSRVDGRLEMERRAGKP